MRQVGGEKQTGQVSGMAKASHDAIHKSHGELSLKGEGGRRIIVIGVNDDLGHSGSNQRGVRNGG